MTRNKVIIRFKNTSEVANKFVENFHAAVQDTGRVKVDGVGSFEVRRMPARDRHDINTNAPRHYEAYNKLVFRPCKELKAAANSHVS